MRTPLFLVFTGLSLAACQSVQDQNTISGFSTPSRIGAIGAGIESGFNKTSGQRTNAQGDGFAYASGPLEDGGIGAYAGILPQTRVGAAPSRGSATLDGAYTLTKVSNISVTGGFITGSSSTVGGDITLRANFDNGTLRGTSDNGRLRVQGELEGTNGLDGKVIYDGVRGNLTGRANDREVIAAFNGNDENLIYAGGIIADGR